MISYVPVFGPSAMQRDFCREVGRYRGYRSQTIRYTEEKFERKYTLLNLKPATTQK